MGLSFRVNELTEVMVSHVWHVIFNHLELYNLFKEKTKKGGSVFLADV